MRRLFANQVYRQMKKDENIWVLTGDLGFGMWNTVKKKFPERFINTGAAEQSLMGIAVGLAKKGKIPVVYSITTFLLYRPFETIRNYINNEKIPVKLVGSGRDKDYEVDGFSHWSTDARRTLKMFKNIEQFWPETKEELDVQKFLYNEKPSFVSLRR